MENCLPFTDDVDLMVVLVQKFVQHVYTCINVNNFNKSNVITLCTLYDLDTFVVIC